MKIIHKIVAATLLSASFSTCNLAAMEYEEYDSMCGLAYEDCHRMNYLAPAAALGVVAVVGLVAIIVNNSGDGTKHVHVHCR